MDSDTTVFLPRLFYTITGWCLASFIGDWTWGLILRDEDRRRVALGIPSVFD